MQFKHRGTAGGRLFGSRLHCQRNYGQRHVVLYHAVRASSQVRCSFSAVINPFNNLYREGCYTLPELLLAHVSAAQALHASFTVQELRGAG